MGQLKMAFENDYPNRQTIDRESGAFLKFEGGTPERGIERFSFHWKGETMKFYAKNDGYGAERGKWQPNIRWTFFQVGIPDHMQDQREEIGNMIKQALEAHGYGYDRESFKDVERIEQMYDEAYDTYEDSGALDTAIASLNDWEHAEHIAQQAIENMMRDDTPAPQEGGMRRDMLAFSK